MTDATASVHPFDEAVRLKALGDGQFSGRITPAYSNMVGPFGGVIAAVMLNSALSHPARQGDPAALTVNFAAPIKDADFSVTACAAQTNRSNQHWVMQLEQDGVTAVTATAMLVSRRESWRSTEAAPPSVPAANAVAPLDGDAIPEWARWVSSYDLRYVQGKMLFDEVEQPDSISTLWARDNPARALDFLSLAALSDVFFPRVLVRRHHWIPSGTVSLTTYFHADTEALEAQSTDFLLGTAQASRFHDMYFDQDAQLWGTGNVLLASTHQLVYYRK